MSEGRNFYITTAIDYVNGRPHLGHAYEKVTTDAIARYKELMGYQVRYLTGTDEHGIKVQRSAAEAGQPEQEYVDQLAAEFRATWDRLEIRYDDFIRTTETRHMDVVQRLLERLNEAGDLYEAEYEGWYCAGCEAFKTEKELEKGLCPTHKKEPEKVKESNLFFRLSNYTQPLLELLDNHPDFIAPETRRNEIRAVLESGLEDISMSRASVTWGVPIPFKEESTVYVWFDALINYVSALGLEGELYDRFWPADVHIIGKDITRFHCIYWPAMLMSAGLPLPRKVFGHGFVLSVGGDKMGKSLGNVVDPLSLVEQMGPDPLRWYLCSEIPYGKDGEFSIGRFEDCYNAHLANEIGNLASRVLNMVARYRGAIPQGKPGQETVIEEALEAAIADYTEAMDRLALHEGCAAIRRLAGVLNEQIQLREPFKMAKVEEQAEELDGLLHTLLAGLQLLAVLVQPFMPTSATKLLTMLGAQDQELRMPPHGQAALNAPRVGHAVEKPAPLFPRLQ